jgi:hypothetical protein
LFGLLPEESVYLGRNGHGDLPPRSVIPLPRNRLLRRQSRDARERRGLRRIRWRWHGHGPFRRTEG